MSWLIEHNGVRKTFEEWGIHNGQRSLISLDTDTFSFDAVRGIEEDDIFPRGDSIKIFKDDVQWFYGMVDQTPRTASAENENHSYTVVGPWWYLAHLVYQQTWSELADPLAGPSGGYIPKYRSHLLLGYDVNGNFLSTRSVILDALNYCIACAIENGSDAPFQIGEINIPEFYAPIYEFSNRTCREVILRELKWTPDAVGSVDYSTVPPTLHIRQRSALAKKSFNAGRPVSTFQIRPRYDLQVPEVVIKYEMVTIIDGLAYPQLIVDAAPANATGRKFGGLTDTISLEGGQIVYTYATIVCEDVNPASTDWLKAKHSPFAQETVRNLQIVQYTRDNDELPRELVAGNIAAWMLGNGAVAKRELISIVVDYDLADASGKVIESRKAVTVEIELTTTNLSSGTFRAVESQIVSEPVPVGLAGYLYGALKVLHFEGSIQIHEQECSGGLAPGDLISLTGAKAEYATMNAVTQSVQEDIETGVTTITIGPPKHLEASDIVEFLETNRSRLRMTPATTMSSGNSFSATPVSLGKETPVKNTNAENGSLDLFTVAKWVVIDPTDFPVQAAAGNAPWGGTIRIRELPICDDTDENLGPRKRWIKILCSEIYDKPQT